MSKKTVTYIFLTFTGLFSLMTVAHAYAPPPNDRKEFKRIEKLVTLVIYAKLAGFSDKDLNKIVLTDRYKKQEIKNIVTMLNFIRDKYRFKESEILAKIIETDDPVVDLYELVRRFLAKDTFTAKKRQKLYTASDVFYEFRQNEKKNITFLRGKVRINIPE